MPDTTPLSPPDPHGPCPVCGRYRNRAMTVDAVVVRDDRVLLIKRKNDPFKNCWALPGGYMDFDETALQAALRELEEETGLRAKRAEYIGLFDEPARHPQQVVTAAFRVTEWEGEPRAGDDAGAVAWFGTAALPATLAFDHDRVIARALRPRTQT